MVTNQGNEVFEGKKIGILGTGKDLKKNGLGTARNESPQKIKIRAVRGKRKETLGEWAPEKRET